MSSSGPDGTSGEAAAAVMTPAGVGDALPRRRHRRAPTHFVVGTALLYAVVLGTFLLHRSPLQHATPDYRRFVPMAAGASFYVASNLFLLIVGRGHVSRYTVLKVTAATLVLASALSLGLRAEFIYDRLGPTGHDRLRRGLLGLVQVKQRLFASNDELARAARFAGMTMVEEAVKLLPVFYLIRRRRIGNAQAAMLCGALSGLTFGTVEAISYGYLIYPAAGAAVTTYLTRFFVMSPLHAIWDALAGALVFFLSNPAGGAGAELIAPAARGAAPRPALGAFVAAYALAVVVHVAHNALQEIVGPMMQIVSVFALLAPLYYTARIARRRAARQGSPDGGQLVGDLHLLTVSLATWFLATSVTFSWVLGVDAARGF